MELNKIGWFESIARFVKNSRISDLLWNQSKSTVFYKSFRKVLMVMAEVKNVWDLIVTTIIEADFRTFGVLWLAGSGCRSWTIKEDSSQFHFSSIYSLKTQRLEPSFFCSCWRAFLILLKRFVSRFPLDRNESEGQNLHEKNHLGTKKKTTHNGNNDAARPRHLRFKLKPLFRQS